MLVYIALSFVYKSYLNIENSVEYYPDRITNLVAKQSKMVLNSVGYKAEVLKHPDEPSMKLMVRGKYLARVIEGCNSISVIILFISFIVAFSGKLKTTLVFLFLGSMVIYIVNIFRIVILSIGLYHYPLHSEILHAVVFPGLIYGMVFLLWMLWVNTFSNVGKNKS